MSKWLSILLLFSLPQLYNMFERLTILTVLCAGDMTQVMEIIANIVVESSSASEAGKKKDAAPSIVEDVAGHMSLKKLIINDRQRMLDGDMREWAFC